MVVRSGRKVSKKMGRRRSVAARRRTNRRVAKLANSEYASAKQTILTENDTANLLYTLYDTNLSNFSRLAQIAQAYQYYRITKIELRVKPFADTFTNAAANSIPYFLWLIDRNESFDFASNGLHRFVKLEQSQFVFDDKTINIHWKPSVIQTLPSDGFNPPVGQTYMNSRLSPWLPTNRYAGQELAAYQWAPSTVPHRGLIYGVQQDLSTSAWQYGTEITVYVQFKKPAIVFRGQTEETFVAAKPKSLVPKENPVVPA